MVVAAAGWIAVHGLHFFFSTLFSRPFLRTCVRINRQRGPKVRLSTQFMLHVRRAKPLKLSFFLASLHLLTSVPFQIATTYIHCHPLPSLFSPSYHCLFLFVCYLLDGTSNTVTSFVPADGTLTIGFAIAALRANTWTIIGKTRRGARLSLLAQISTDQFADCSYFSACAIF